MIYPRTFGQYQQDVLEPSNPQTVSIRPLNFGMDTIHPRTLSKIRNLQNLYPREDGWRLRPGLWKNFSDIPIDTGELILDYIDMGSMSINGVLAILSDKYLYQTQDGITYERAPWALEVFTADATSSGTDLVAPSGVDFSSYGITDSMYVMLNDGTGVFNIRREISSIEAGKIVVATALPSPLASLEFKVFYEFAAAYPYSVNWARGPGKVYLVDSSNIGIVEYDGAVLTALPIHKENNGAATFDGAATILYSEGRLCIGNCIGENNGYNMFRWSSVLDISEFQTQNYTILTESSGSILSLSKLENYIIASTQDDIYVGKIYTVDTSYTMPWYFRKLDSMGKVPMSQKAIISAMNAVYYIAQDDVYSLSFKELNASGDFKVVPLNCPVASDFFGQNPPTDARICYDPKTMCLIFANSDVFSTVYVMSMRTGGWAKFLFPVQFSSMAKITYNPFETYATAEAKGWTYDEAEIATRTYQSFIMGFGTQYMMFVTNSGEQYVFDDSISKDFDTTEIVAYAETGDMDFDNPDDEKAIYKAKILTTGASSMMVWGSTNRGSTWKNLGTASISAGQEEVHFRISGSQIAIKFQFNTIDPSMTIEGISFTIKTKGDSVVRGA